MTKGVSEKLSGNKNYVFYFAVIATFISIFLLNIFTPYCADDYSYNTSKSLYDVLKNEYVQYMTWTGRSIAHINVRIFLMLPKVIFNIVNSVVYTLLTVLIYIYAKLEVRKGFDIILYVFISACMWLYLPIFGQTVLWLTGSCNYLWGTVIILLFILPYRLYSAGKFQFYTKGKYGLTILIFLVGILAGWCNENTSAACILLVTLLSLYCLFNKWKITGWMISGFIGSVIGYLIMFKAPGNAIRSQYFENNRSKLEIIYEKFSAYTSYIEKPLMVLIILLCLFIVIQVVMNKDIKKTIMPIIFLLASFFAIYIMIFSPTGFSERSLFGGVSFLIISTAMSFNNIVNIKAGFSKVITLSTTLVLFLYSCSSYSVNIIEMAYTKRLYNARENYIISERENGNLDIVVKKFPYDSFSKHNPKYGWDEITEDKDYWSNLIAAEEYGLNSIISSE